MALDGTLAKASPSDVAHERVKGDYPADGGGSMTASERVAREASKISGAIGRIKADAEKDAAFKANDDARKKFEDEYGDYDRDNFAADARGDGPDDANQDEVDADVEASESRESENEGVTGGDTGKEVEPQSREEAEAADASRVSEKDEAAFNSPNEKTEAQATADAYAPGEVEGEPQRSPGSEPFKADEHGEQPESAEQE